MMHTTPRTVWIVEDSALAAKLASDALTGEFDCTMFSSATAALELLVAGRTPDVLLLDWEMPDISGVELCRLIRQTYDATALPVLLVTGRRSSAEVVEGLTAGANDYVPKPYIAEELLARVKSLARVRELWQRSRQAEEQLLTTLRSIGDAVISTDWLGRVAFMNVVAEHLTGWKLADARGTLIADVFRGADRDGAPDVCPAVKVLLDGVPVDSSSHTLVQRDDVRIHVEASASPIRDDSGVLTGVVLVFRDVGHRLQAAAERERLLVEARLRVDFERQLIGIVSHDLRNPLSIIALGAKHLMASEQVDDKGVRVLMRMKNAADRGTRMVGDLLDFTQARLGGGIPIARSPGNLHTVVRLAIEEAQLAHPDRNILTTIHGDAHGHWDLDRLSQVVTNLVANAAKYAAPDSAIDIRCIGDLEGVTFSVHNRGTAIDALALGRIFQPMQRATSQLENSVRSVGLGLFIVKHLVEAHGGRVSVSSSAEEGTTFGFWVPKR